MYKLVIGSITALAVLVMVGIFYQKSQAEQVGYKPSVPSYAQKKLVFSDEFNGSALDKNKWNTCYDNYSVKYDGCTNYGNNEGEWYKSSQVSVKDGSLVLSAKKQDAKGLDKSGYDHVYPYTSGMVSSGRYTRQTPEKWSKTYGFFEARIKAPDGKAVWPAFWLLPVSREWPPEIDVMEILGDRPDELLTTYFWKAADGNAAHDSSLYKHDSKLTNGWHTYAVNWQPSTIEWYLDGKKIKTASSKNVPNTAMQIILNLAVGGTLPGDPDATTPASSTMLVDYIRVYE